MPEIIAKSELWLTADKLRVVAKDDPEAVMQLCKEGDLLSERCQKMYGIEHSGEETIALKERDAAFIKTEEDHDDKPKAK